MTFGKILCPIDFSPGAQQALRVAVRLALQSNAELVVAHAWHVPPSAFAGEYTFTPQAIELMRDDAERGLAAAADTARDLGATRVSTRLLAGVPWDVIVAELGDPAYGLAVVGTHGRSGVARVLLGSVAERVVRHAPCSVLAVRPSSVPEPFRHVLVPVDFSTSSQHAASLAGTLGSIDGARLTLLHVLELPVAYAGEPPVADFERVLDARSSTLLDRWASELRASSKLEVATRSRIGSPGAQTLAVLDDDPTVDLVVVGSHGRTGIARVVLGSVAEKLVRHASCPVLVARSRG